MHTNLSVKITRYTILSYHTKKACIIDTGYMNDKNRMCFYRSMYKQLHTKISKPLTVIANVILVTSKQFDTLLQFYYENNNIVCVGHHLNVPLYYVAGSPVGDRVWDDKSVAKFNEWDTILSFEV